MYLHCKAVKTKSCGRLPLLVIYLFLGHTTCMYLLFRYSSKQGILLPYLNRANPIVCYCEDCNFMKHTWNSPAIQHVMAGHLRNRIF